MGKLIASLLLAGILLGPAYAESSLSVRGFGTLGLARSSSEHAEFVRDLSQPVGIKGGQWSGRIDSILGLQANWQATRELEFVGQAVSRLRYDRGRNPELMWAFAKWEPDPRLVLRAGRIGADFMMLADSRLVGYSYLTARPPTDFFGPLFFAHFDGADAVATLSPGEGVLRGKLFAGKTQEKSAGALGVWDTSGSPVRGVVLEYIAGPWHFRSNLASIRFVADMNVSALTAALRTVGAAAAADSLLTRDKEARFLSLGVVYDNGPLLLQGMLNGIRRETVAFQDSRAGYLLAAYSVGAVTPYVGVSWWKSKLRGALPAIPDAGLETQYRGFVAGTKVDRDTYTLGARWDFRQDMALKFQWDAVRASPDTSFSFADAQPGWNGKTNVLTLTLDFVF